MSLFNLNDEEEEEEESRASFLMTLREMKQDFTNRVAHILYDTSMNITFHISHIA